jgi:hypothetical protein
LFGVWGLRFEVWGFVGGDAYNPDWFCQMG